MKRKAYSAAFGAAVLTGGFAACYVTNRGTARPTYQTHPASGAPTMQALLCGKPDDERVHIPADWDSFVPPARGQNYIDPTFGCKIVRLTDAIRDGVAEHHYYATLTPVSADDSKILIFNEHGQWFVADLVGGLVVPTTKMPASNAGTMLWDAADGNVFYFMKGNSLMKGTILGKRVKVSAIHTFAEYDVVVLPDKTDLSIDGNSFAMWAGTTSGKRPLNIFTYNMRTNKKKAPYVTGCSQNAALVQGSCVHGITQTSDDNVIIDFANDGQCLECGNRLWDGNMLVHIQDKTNHMDTGYDLNGNAVFIGLGNDYVLSGETNPCPSGWGLDVRQLSRVSSATCLLDKEPSLHVSYRGSVSQPWAAISSFDERKRGPELFNNNQGFQEPSSKNWLLYEDEVILARVDGSAIYRLAHARSRSAEGYWAQPRAAISRDGKYVVFDSNMAFAQTGCPLGLVSCSDVYLIRVQ